MKNFKKSIAIIGSIAMLFSVSAVSVSALEDNTNNTVVGTSDSSTLDFDKWYSSLTDEQKETYGRPIDGNGNRIQLAGHYHGAEEYFDCTDKSPYNITLNNGDVFPLYAGSSVITDDDGNIIAYEGYNNEGNGYCTIYNGEKIYGVGYFDSNYKLAMIESTVDEHPEYPLLNNTRTFFWSNLDGSLNGYFDSYYIYGGVYEHKITLPNNEIAVLPKEANILLITYNAKGEYVGYWWSVTTIPADSPEDKIVVDKVPTIGDSSSTVGDSDVLPSEPTGIRGDVNYDGKVNVADIITLRRYLLHIIEW